MSVLAIDIGLRNLSFCCMSGEIPSDITSYKIHLWDVYNILDSDDYKCNELQKNGKVCGRKCSMTHDKKFYCKTHFPKDITIIKSSSFKKKSVNDYLLQDIAKIFIQRIQDIYQENQDIFNGVKSIIVELQPKINQKMKFVSHILYGKFVELYKDTDVTIRFVRAITKLRAYTGPPILCKLKGKYAQRKWLSIEYAKWFLENKFSSEQKDIWFEKFLSCDKKDDESDCFLYAINAIHGIPKKQKYQKNGKCIK